MASEKTSSKFKWILLVAVIAGLIAVSQTLDVGSWMQGLLASIDRLGIWGPLIFIAAYIAATVAFLPASILTLGAGTAFGVVHGTIYVSIASTLSAGIAFLIGRYGARKWIAAKIEGNARFAAIDEAVAKEGWKIVVLTRLSPVFPFVLLNYAFGLTKVRFPHYFLASWIGMLPATVLYVYIGSLGKAVAESGDKTPGQWGLLVVGLLATLGVTIYITKVARKALNRHVAAD